MRNIKKQSQQGQALLEKNNRLDITSGELDQFFEAFNQTAREQGIASALFYTIGDAFKMGLAVGARNFNK